MELATGQQSRPRNVDWKRAAALLYGDWGTSKTYVTGIAFSIAMFSSFWFVLAVGALTALVGVNYIWVCKYFPQGGGVYSAAREHSRHLALIGGFLLVANYLVTAALSCFEAFVYFNFQFEDAKRWAILAIFLIGVVNFFGPKHSGSLAMWLAVRHSRGHRIAGHRSHPAHSGRDRQSATTGPRAAAVVGGLYWRDSRLIGCGIDCQHDRRNETRLRRVAV